MGATSAYQGTTQTNALIPLVEMGPHALIPLEVSSVLNQVRHKPLQFVNIYSGLSEIVLKVTSMPKRLSTTSFVGKPIWSCRDKHVFVNLILHMNLNYV